MFVRVQRFPIVTSPLANFERDIDSMLSDILQTGPARSSYPAVDIAEYENETVLVAEIPGVSKEDVKLAVQDGVLTISGVRKANQLPEKSALLRNEIRTGEFTRTIQLPEDAKVDAISAELTNGVLRVVLPKSEQARPREIKVQ